MVGKEMWIENSANPVFTIRSVRGPAHLSSYLPLGYRASRPYFRCERKGTSSKARFLASDLDVVQAYVAGEVPSLPMVTHAFPENLTLDLMSRLPRHPQLLSRSCPGCTCPCSETSSAYRVQDPFHKPLRRGRQ